MPKFSAAQRRVIESKDPGLEIRFLGFDEKNRPVVSGNVGIPRQRRVWAITKAGDPTDQTGELTSHRIVGRNVMTNTLVRDRFSNEADAQMAFNKYAVAGGGFQYRVALVGFSATGSELTIVDHDPIDAQKARATAIRKSGAIGTREHGRSVPKVEDQKCVGVDAANSEIPMAPYVVQMHHDKVVVDLPTGKTVVVYADGAVDIENFGD